MYPRAGGGTALSTCASIRSSSHICSSNALLLQTQAVKNKQALSGTYDSKSFEIQSSFSVFAGHPKKMRVGRRLLGEPTPFLNELFKQGRLKLFYWAPSLTEEIGQKMPHRRFLRSISMPNAKVQTEPTLPRQGGYSILSP